MARYSQPDRSGSVEGSNVPGNPLRSYRMSMLAHGFVDPGEGQDFVLDESDPVTYSVVRLRGEPLTVGTYVALAIVVAVLLGLIIFLA